MKVRLEPECPDCGMPRPLCVCDRVAPALPRRRGPAAVLTEPEIRALLGTFSRGAVASIRDRALILLLWRAGLRIGEALALEPRDLELAGERPTLRVRDGKGGNQRTVGVHQEAAGALERWLAVRADLGLARRRYVFLTISKPNPGRKVDPEQIRRMLKTRAARAGLEGRRVHPHAFRATLAVELAGEGVPLPAIRDVLGHKNIANTDAYLRRVFPEQAIDAVISRATPAPDRSRGGSGT